MDKQIENLNLNDDVDALGFLGKQRPSLPEIPINIGSVEDDNYAMNYPRRGKCVIFNHKNFQPHTGLNTRNGTDADAARLYCLFRELDFEVTLHTDLKTKDVLKELSKLGKEDHTQNSSFVCCILSHGEEGIVYGSDGKYPTESIFAPFRGNACLSLLGKPKMFFIQACQGDQLDEGSKLSYQKISKDSGSAKEAVCIPTHADFLIFYSTVPGFYSWRNTSQGSWFIQALCATVKKHAKDMDLLQILTKVNRRVALDFESHTPHDPNMDLKKQVPYITSTLLRDIRFYQN